MPNSEKDRLAPEVEDRWVDFQDGLSNKRRYPVEHFWAFWDAGKRYAEQTKYDPLIHRKVVAASNGLREFLSVERKRIVPSQYEGRHVLCFLPNATNPRCFAIASCSSLSSSKWIRSYRTIISPFSLGYRIASSFPT